MNKALIDRALKSAILPGAISTVVRLGANIFLVLLVLRQLNDAELAVWWVFVAIGDLALLSDLGFTPAINRVYSYLWAGAKDFKTEGLSASTEQLKPNYYGVAQLHATAANLYLQISLILFVILSTVGSYYLSTTPIESTPHPEKSWLAWGLYILIVCIAVRRSFWISSAEGINRVKETQNASVLGGMAYMVVGGLLVTQGLGLLALVAAIASRTFVSQWICRRAFLTSVPKKYLRNAKPNPEMLRKLWPNAKKFGLMTLGGFMLKRGTLLIGAPYLPTQTVAALGLSQQVGIFIMNISSLWLRVKWPTISILRAQGKIEELSVTFSRRLGWSVTSFTALAISTLLLGNKAFSLMETDKSFLPFTAFCFYLAYLGWQMFYTMFGQLALTENVIPFFKISIATGCCSFILSILLLHYMGLWGLLSAPFIVETAYSGWFTVRRGFKGQCLTLTEFIKTSLSFKF